MEGLWLLSTKMNSSDFLGKALKKKKKKKSGLKKLNEVEVKWTSDFVCCLVLASGGYPGSYEKGKVITGLDDVDDDIVVFHAGTKEDNGQIVTNGGRVINICARGKDLNEVREKVYKASNVINFEGKYCRKDIGLA